MFWSNRAAIALIVGALTLIGTQIAAQAGYPVITVPAGTSSESGMPFGLALMNTAFSEPTLIKYASAIEDLKNHSGPKWKRALPEWRGYLERNLPVIM